MRILYLSTWNFENGESDGVCKKINSQIEVFRSCGWLVDIIYINSHSLIYVKNKEERIIAKLGKIKKTPAYIKMYKHIKNERYDWVYNRFGMFDTFYYRNLKKLKANGARILLEIPTFPYQYERNAGLLNWIMFKWDSLYIPKCKKLVDAIVDNGCAANIWGCNTINVRNGIKVDDIPISSSRKEENIVRFVAVALLQPYHGLERMLAGIEQYYKCGGKKTVIFHIVGDGPEKDKYVQLVNEYNLNEKVFFHGRLGGKELDTIFDNVDIGVCSLGCYKKELFYSSELKAREYLARGIPFILSCDSDLESSLDECMYYKVTNDDTILDISDILDHFDQFGIDEETSRVTMRMLAKNTVDEPRVFEPVIKYIEEN